LASYSSKREAQEALQQAREKLAKAREAKDTKAFDAAMKECENLRVVIDRWPKPRK